MPISRLTSPIRVILLIKLMLTTALLAYAGTSPVATTSYRSVIGGQLNIVTVLKGADRGFSKAASTASGNGILCPGTPVLFGSSPGTATPGVTSGHMIYDIQLNTTGSTPALGCWQVKLSYTTNSGVLTTVGPVWIGTGPLPPPVDEVIDCQFDMGSYLPSSPFSYSLVVSL